MPNAGKILMAVGALIFFAGIIIWFLGNKFNWFGNLPGDVKIERENFKFYAPLMSMILVSIFLSLLIWLFNKFFR